MENRTLVKTWSLIALGAVSLVPVMVACGSSNPPANTAQGAGSAYPQQGYPQQGYPQQPQGYPQQQPMPQQQPGMTAPATGAPATPGQMATPGPAALPCSNDSMCMTHRCNTQYGKCAFPCESDNDCIAGAYCFKSAISTCLPKPPGQ